MQFEYSCKQRLQIYVYLKYKLCWRRRQQHVIQLSQNCDLKVCEIPNFPVGAGGGVGRRAPRLPQWSFSYKFHYFKGLQCLIFGSSVRNWMGLRHLRYTLGVGVLTSFVCSCSCANTSYTLSVLQSGSPMNNINPLNAATIYICSRQVHALSARS